MLDCEGLILVDGELEVLTSALGIASEEIKVISEGVGLLLVLGSAGGAVFGLDTCSGLVRYASASLGCAFHRLFHIKNARIKAFNAATAALRFLFNDVIKPSDWDIPLTAIK